MLKKGQPGWIDNAKPCNTGPQIEEHVRVPHKKKGKKRFGIKFVKKLPWRFSWTWKQWYHTARDRDEAFRTIQKKDDYRSKYYYLMKVKR